MLRVRLMVRPALSVAASDRHHVLMVDDLLPDPTFGAGYPRAFAILRVLVEAGHAVDYYPMYALPVDRRRMEAVFKGAVRFHPGQGARGLRRLLWRDGARYHVLFVSRPIPMAAFLQARWRPAHNADVPVIYDAEAVLAPREQRRRALFGPAWSDADYRAALAAELELARGARAVTAVGQADATLIRSTLDMPVFVLPHPIATRLEAPGPDGRSDFLFVGRLTGPAAQSPNVDSVSWFVTEVMPRLDRLLGAGYKLHVVGKVDAPDIAALASERMVLHGVVDDLRPLYDSCRVFVAPTRYAAGIPLKVVEAMGEGIACVATPLLARQLDTTALATGESANDFARQCARLYRDDRAWLTAQAAGFAHVRHGFSPAAFDRTLAQVIGSKRHDAIPE